MKIIFNYRVIDKIDNVNKIYKIDQANTLES